MGIGLLSSARLLAAGLSLAASLAACSHAPPLPPAVPPATADLAPPPWPPARAISCAPGSEGEASPEWVVRIPGRPADLAVAPDGAAWVASSQPETEGVRPGGSRGVHAYDAAGRRLWWRGRESVPRALVMAAGGEWTWTVNYDGSLTALDRYGRRAWGQPAFCRPVPSPRAEAAELACFYDDDDARDGEWEARASTTGRRTRPLALPAGAAAGQALEIAVSRSEPATGLMVFPGGKLGIWRGEAWPPAAPGALLSLGGMVREARPLAGGARAAWVLVGKTSAARELVALSAAAIGRRHALGGWGDRLQASARGDWALLADDRAQGQSVLAVELGADDADPAAATPRAGWALTEPRPAEFQMPFRAGERGAWVSCVGAGRKSRLAWVERDGRRARWYRLDAGESDHGTLPVGLELLDPRGETALAWMDDGRVMLFAAPLQSAAQ